MIIGLVKADQSNLFNQGQDRAKNRSLALKYFQRTLDSKAKGRWYNNAVLMKKNILKPQFDTTRDLVTIVTGQRTMNIFQYKV